ncbi:MAG: DUF4389 domain-containing protein [gamma proteobacterium symbiont of Bathyaustriella thionipta]|nr:DUF4389 domain-containing protein [gamma proteobacterium symbiont of Bathyaustriella thionipta]MCU7950282.1 DUF4389 domain-containing protein [gamma proteobacterium symbiont of Bathyaustriella thionipta]MCU7951813.1 DUF4389 domain-containing protein [gamma proteobacterium symbiont of Bathyaustriella thionipta]MCU7957549.1 DUF4389 domain-containing protein [gamma proteobacterium symbiont of Bathyaustriella thionipta]MCU7966988.1 DUF4389 domain-containing protein [gamma proteobacterium symbion
MSDDIKEPYKNRDVWLRGLYMLIFMFLLGLVKFVAFAVILFQFLTVLFTTKTNKQLVRFGRSLSIYQYQIMIFLTYNSEEHPFPMSEWPEPLTLSEK